MTTDYRTEKPIPYCPGCGHTIATNNIVKALDKLTISPKDVVFVSDIGCCGLIDPLVSCHTIHGLHGRAAALAMGVTLGLDDPSKKVIVIQGDGGATIGLQNLLEAARMNVNMTLIVQNNMVYGMTGGQISGLTTSEFKEQFFPETSSIPPFDIVKLAHDAGASFSKRIIGRGDYSEVLLKAFTTSGFSLIEVVGLCTPYGIKDIRELSKIALKETEHENQNSATRATPGNKKSLFYSIPVVESKFISSLKERIHIVIAGSAGEGVQLAGELLAKAGLAAGLHTTRKGEYPITVGTGFSISEVILSKKEIHYTGIPAPDVALILSDDGLKKVENILGENTMIIAESELKLSSKNNLYSGNFRKVSGKKGAVITAIAYWVNLSKVLPFDALKNAIMTNKRSKELLPLLDNVPVV